MTTPDHQRWLDEATKYVRLRDELIQKQCEIDAVRNILKECVSEGSETRVLLMRDSSVVVLVSHPFNEETRIQVRPVIS